MQDCRCGLMSAAQKGLSVSLVLLALFLLMQPRHPPV